MSKIKDALVTDVPVNDTDYDYEKFKREQEELDAIDRADMMVGVEEEEKVEGDYLSFSPEEA